MIKFEAENLEIKGNIAIIAYEFEYIARGVREALCDAIGKDNGMKMYSKIINNSYISEKEREEDSAKQVENLRKEHPDLFAVISSGVNEVIHDLVAAMEEKEEQE